MTQMNVFIGHKRSKQELEFNSRFPSKRSRKTISYVENCAITIQSLFRGRKFRIAFTRIKSFVISVQYKFRRNKKVQLRTIVKIQSLIRMSLARRQFLKLKSRVEMIQRRFRLKNPPTKEEEQVAEEAV